MYAQFSGILCSNYSNSTPLKLLKRLTRTPGSIHTKPKDVRCTDKFTLYSSVAITSCIRRVRQTPCCHVLQVKRATIKPMTSCAVTERSVKHGETNLTRVSGGSGGRHTETYYEIEIIEAQPMTR